MKPIVYEDFLEGQDEVRAWAEENIRIKGGRIIASVSYGSSRPGVEPGFEAHAFAAWVKLGAEGFRANIAEDSAQQGEEGRRVDMAMAAARVGQAMYNGKLPEDFGKWMRRTILMGWSREVNPLPLVRDMIREFGVNLNGHGHYTCL